jgi:hypothetical protein
MGAALALWETIRLLRPSQARHLASTIWLTDPRGNRGSGRTLLTAIAQIRHAIVSPGSKIPLLDHHASSNPAHIATAVSGILNGMGPKSNLIIGSGGTWIQYEGKNGLEGPDGVSKKNLLADFMVQASSAMASGASMEELIGAVMEAEVGRTMEA